MVILSIAITVHVQDIKLCLQLHFFPSFSFFILRRHILLKSENRPGTTLSTMVAWMWGGGGR